MELHFTHALGNLWPPLCFSWSHCPFGQKTPTHCLRLPPPSSQKCSRLCLGMTVDLGAVPNPIPQGLPNLGEGLALWRGAGSMVPVHFGNHSNLGLEGGG